MVSERLRRLDRGGWTFVEVLLVVAIIGILAGMSIPLFVRYWQSAAVRAGAQEMRVGLQQAKQLAIRNRQNICVFPVAPNGYRYLQNTCGGAAIVMPGTDGAGTFHLQQTNVTLACVTCPGGGITFRPLGDSAQGGTLSVTRLGGNPLNVRVTVAGQITTP